MSLIKISDLQELTTWGSNDFIPIVDASGILTTKKITYANFLYRSIPKVVVPGGGTNDDVVINLALAALGNIGGGVLELVEATYTISNSILIPSNTVLKGRGWGTIIKIANGANITTFNAITNQDINNGNVNVQAWDFLIDGNGVNQLAAYSANGTDFRFVTNLFLRNIYAKNCGFNDSVQSVGISTDNSSGLIVNCRSESNTHYGFSIFESSEITLMSCITKSNKRHGFGGGGNSPSTHAHDVNFIGCQSISDVQGFWLREIDGLSIDDCEVNGNGVLTQNANVTAPFGMIFSAITRLKIDGVRIHDIAGEGIRVDGPFLSYGDASSDIQVLNSQIYNCTSGSGIFMRANGVSRAQLINNIINNCSSNGIINATCPDSIINNNTIKSCGKSGIQYNQSINGQITDNICKNNGTSLVATAQNGIQLWTNDASLPASNNIVTGNRCYDDQGSPTQVYGIWETANCDSNIYSDNNVTGNLTGGMNLLGTNRQVRNNKGYVTESSGTAIVASGTTSIAVTHGLAATPALKDIVVTATNNLGSATKFWITSPTSTQFTINVDVNPGATTATFAWRAIIL